MHISNMLSLQITLPWQAGVTSAYFVFCEYQFIFSQASFVVVCVLHEHGTSVKITGKNLNIIIHPANKAHEAGGWLLR